MHSSTPEHPLPRTSTERGLLALVERWGNRLPEPWLLFVYGLLIVLVVSKVAAWQGWSVDAKVVDGGKVVTQTLVARDLLSSDGLYWVLSQLIVNLLAFPPLGVVLVGMLAVGVAEKTGLIAALLKVMLRLTPRMLITPAFVFVGAMSSLGSDAGYVVLPPIAAVMFVALGRSPIVGVATVFAGIAGGFGANLAITGSDAILAGLTTTAARFADTGYTVAATCNWYFSAAAVVVVTGVGWAVTRWVVEPRFARRAPEDGGPQPVDDQQTHHTLLTTLELRGLAWSGVIFLVAVASAVAMTVIPGMPLHGTAQAPPLAGPPTGAFNPRWIVSIVPILFFVFLLPGLAYGIATRQIRSDRDVGKIMSDSMAQLAPVIVLAFFAAQFIAAFNHSRLGLMLATAGGEWICHLNLPRGLLLLIFVLFIAALDLLISSMSAKYAFVSPVFVPMFMTGAGISPELTQAAYRLADSCTNVITPVNAYLVIILAVLRRYMPGAGLGTIIALMLPYCLAILAGWMILLQVWVWLDVPLGPDGPLHYPNR